MITDLMGHPLGVVSSFQTNRDFDVLLQDLVRRIKQVLIDYKEVGACEGVGLVIPGMVDLAAGRVLHAPTLAWRDVNIRDRSPLQSESLFTSKTLVRPARLGNSGRHEAMSSLQVTPFLSACQMVWELAWS
jgi:hypothetical protein